MDSIMENESVAVLVENEKEIDILKDFFSVLKQCRESYYFLLSVKILLDGQPWVEMPPTITELSNQVSSLIAEFKSLDEIVLGKKPDDVKEGPVPFEDKHFLEISQVVDIIKQSIQLKSRMDKTQLLVLDCMIDNLNRAASQLSSKYEQLQLMDLYFRIGQQMILAFSHSSSEDRIITYTITCDDERVTDFLNGQGIRLPQTFKIRDYSFPLSKKRLEFKQQYRAFFDLLKAVPQVEQQEQLKLLTEKQCAYNKQTTVLTYLVAWLTLITAWPSIKSVFGLIAHAINHISFAWFAG